MGTGGKSSQEREQKNKIENDEAIKARDRNLV